MSVVPALPPEAGVPPLRATAAAMAFRVLVPATPSARQAVFLLEAPHGRLGLRAEIAGDLRPVIAQRRQILLEVANVRALGIELEAACGGTRAGKSCRPSPRRPRQSSRWSAAGNAVRRQAVLALKALDGRHGLRPRVAGDLAVVIAQRLQLGLHLADRRAAGIFADIGRIRIGGAGPCAPPR